MKSYVNPFYASMQLSLLRDLYNKLEKAIESPGLSSSEKSKARFQLHDVAESLYQRLMDLNHPLSKHSLEEYEQAIGQDVVILAIQERGELVGAIEEKEKGRDTGIHLTVRFNLKGVWMTRMYRPREIFFYIHPKLQSHVS